MLNTKRTFIEKVTLQKVGSKLREEINVLAKQEQAISEAEEKALKSLFLSSIKATQELQQFGYTLKQHHHQSYLLSSFQLKY